MTHIKKKIKQAMDRLYGSSTSKTSYDEKVIMPFINPIKKTESTKGIFHLFGLTKKRSDELMTLITDIIIKEKTPKKIFAAIGSIPGLTHEEGSYCMVTLGTGLASLFQKDHT